MSLLFSPQYIKKHLDRFVVGQERAKQDLAIAGFYQSMRQQVDKKKYEDEVESIWEERYPAGTDRQSIAINYNDDGTVREYGVTEPKHKQMEAVKRDFNVKDYIQSREVSLPGKAALILGPSGCGKTYLVSLLGKVLGAPVVYVNAMELTNTGYVGRTIADICDDALVAHKRSGAFDEWQMAYPIIFVDEFDKRCASDDRSWDKQIQYSLLAGLEGKTMTDSSTRGSSVVETSRSLWILGGSFQHLRDLKKKESKSIGYTNCVEDSKKIHHVYSAADLEDGGIIKEIAGRLPIVTEVFELTREELRQALDKENSTLKPYEDLYRFLGKKFTPTEDQINAVIDKCLESKTGARGLNYAIHEVFKDDLNGLEYEIV